MPTTAAEALILLAAVVGSGSMTALTMWFYQRVRRLERENQSLLEVTQQVQALSDQTATVQEQVGELSERLDFAERMLTRGKEGT